MEPNGWTKTKYDWLKFNNAMCGNIKKMEHTVTVSEDVNGSEWLVPKNRFVPAQAWRQTLSGLIIPTNACTLVVF